MDFYERFKRFLGFREPHDYNEPNRFFPEPPREDTRDNFEPPFHHGRSRNFNIFTDPLEMHRYFEQQMSDMLKSFGFGEFGDGFSHHFEFPPMVEFPEEQDGAKSGDLREQFLKPGFEKAITDGVDEKKDEDIDGKLDVRDWGSIFRGENSVTSHQPQVAPKSYFFGQSLTSKTITNPDGSVETHRTVRDNQGNEETTITRKLADKEYTMTKRRDKDGKEEIIENFVNLDEKEVDKYFPKQPQRFPQLDQQRWPLFDRFFK